MKSKIALLIIFNLLVFSPSLTKAELGPDSIILREKRQETIKEKQNVIKDRQEINKDLIKDIKETRQNIKENVLEQKETRNAFKENTKTINDERKKLLMENISNRMLTVNKNQTNRMKKALEKLSNHINKLQERVAQAKKKGIDVSTVEASIITAKTAINDALVVVEEQAAKNYSFSIVDETKLGQAIKTSYNTFSQDLKNSQQFLIKAKKSVTDAYKSASTLKFD